MFNFHFINTDDDYAITSAEKDFNWLLKISCTWEDAKIFRKDMEKSQSSSVHFRLQTLLAIEQMQAAFGTQDLGKLFCRPLRDTEGTIVFCAIKRLFDPKQISFPLRWMSIAKLQKRIQPRELYSERVSDSGISMGGWESSPRLIGDILLLSIGVS